MADADELRAEMDRLMPRYEAGIAWLIEHDPTGSFYFWVKSNLTAASPMPAQSENRRDDWIAYLKGYRTWEAIDARLLSIERRLAKVTA